MTSSRGDGAGAWLAAFGRPGVALERTLGPGDYRGAAVTPAAPRSRPGLDLLAAPSRWSPSVTDGPGCRVIFEGVLHNGAELRARFADRLPREATDADLVAQGYHAWGEGAVLRLKGVFALVIEDRDRDVLLCARDPLGMRPLFYAEVDRALLLSPSVEALLGHPGMSADINRACLVARLTRRWPAPEETYFTRIGRVPPGHILRVGGAGRRVSRYWDPVPPDLEWIPDGEVEERFGTLLEQAVARCLAPEPAGIYLSGGLDSSMIATVATELCRGHGGLVPWALSLVFSGSHGDEADVQRGVATELGLGRIQLPFRDAAGPNGTLGAALQMTRTLPAPLTVIWRPALLCLALRARERGCQVILTGDGGDEWLWENPLLAADLLRSLDLAGFYRLWQTYARSYHFSRRAALRMLLWRCGAARVLPDAWRTAATRGGMPGLVRRRRHAAATRAAASPPWVAPDPTLRAHVAQRLEECYLREESAPRAGSHYLRDTRSRLDSPEPWFREEETFLVGERTGVPVREPFWDPDLIELLVRVHPRVRSAGGLAKALVRRPLARRFPGLGFERQRKSWLGAAFLSVLATETGPVRQAMGGTDALADLGVVDAREVRVLLDDALAGKGPRQRLGWAWELLNLEAWVRAHR